MSPILIVLLVLGGLAILIASTALVSMLQRRDVMMRASEQAVFDATSVVLKPERTSGPNLRDRLEEWAKEREQNEELQHKGLDVLVRAVAAAGDERLLLVLAGDGPERDALRRLAEDTGTRLVLLGDVEWERIAELYVAADVFALLSEREPWAVVVNEAAACGLPLVLSDRVGAAHDLLRDGENGFLVAAGDVDAAAGALRTLAADPGLRRAQGARSRELARDWGYGPSVEGFLEAVREAVELASPG